MIIFFVIVAVLLFLYSLRNFNDGLRLYLFSYYIIPSYMAFEITSGLSLNSQRVLAVVLLAAAATRWLMIARTGSGVSYIARVSSYDEEGIIKFFSIYFAVKFVATFTSSSGSMGSYISELLTYPMLGVFVYLFWVSEQKFIQLLKLIVICGVVLELVSVIEFIRSESLFTWIPTAHDFQAEYLLGKIRDDAYRVQATFANSLVFSEFLVILIPVAFFLHRVAVSNATRIFALSFMLMAPPLVIATQARSGVIVILALLLIVIIGRFVLRLGGFNRLFVKKLLIVIGASSVIWLLFGGMETVVQLLGLFFSGDVSSSASLFDRLDQYRRTMELFFNAPLIGYGVQSQANAIEGLGNIDNYYLRIIIETGGVGSAVFLLACHRLIRLISRAYKDADSPLQRQLVIAVSTSLALQLIYMLFLSIPFNHVLLFLFIGSLLAIRRDQLRKVSETIHNKDLITQ